jgi:hypothetical protein
MRIGIRIPALLLATSAVVACDQARRPYEIRGMSEGYRIYVTADTLPPRAQDEITWRVRVSDARTGQPVEGGEGALWARHSKDGHETHNGLAQAPELGTYTTKLPLVMAGQWSMGVVFRRDSTKPFATVAWMQEVRAPRPLGR